MTEVPHVTYLLGAGASAATMPVVSGMRGVIHYWLEVVSNDRFYRSFDFWPIEENDFNLERQKLIEDFKWALDVESKHMTIDTYAKKLYLQFDINSLNRLKAVLSSMFLMHQFQKRPDPRYESFFTSLLQDSLKRFPPQVKVLTWNYDSQMELAYRDLTTGIKHSPLPLEVTSKPHQHWIDAESFNVIRLNGSTAWKGRDYPRRQVYDDDILGNDDIEMFSKVLDLHSAIRDGFAESELSFAWEQSNKNQQGFLQRVSEAVSKTEILVIIGYSFPFFNRKVDRQICGSMSALRKIYVQDKNPELPISRFYAVRPDIHSSAVVPYTELSEFLLPPEL